MELKLEKLNSQRLKGYFKENPKDEHLLSQGKTMENMEQEEHQKNVPEEPCHEATILDSYYKIPWEALYHEAPGWLCITMFLGCLVLTSFLSLLFYQDSEATQIY